MHKFGILIVVCSGVYPCAFQKKMEGFICVLLPEEPEGFS